MPTLATADRTMESKQEFAERQARTFMTVLFTRRAERHLKTLAEIYNWSPEMLEEHKQRFIKPIKMIPVWESN